MTLYVLIRVFDVLEAACIGTLSWIFLSIFLIFFGGLAWLKMHLRWIAASTAFYRITYRNADGYVDNEFSSLIRKIVEDPREIFELEKNKILTFS